MDARFIPRIDRPCAQDWQTMRGGDKRRFCEQCQLHVHNFSAMSHAEREDVLANRTTRKCIGYVVGENAIQVRSDTWLLLQRVLRPWRTAVALFVLLSSSLTGSAASRPGKKPASTSSPQARQCRSARDGKESVDFKWLGGVIIPTTPLWKRILFFWRGSFD